MWRSNFGSRYNKVTAHYNNLRCTLFLLNWKPFSVDLEWRMFECNTIKPQILVNCAIIQNSIWHCHHTNTTAVWCKDWTRTTYLVTSSNELQWHFSQALEGKSIKKVTVFSSSYRCHSCRLHVRLSVSDRDVRIFRIILWH